MNNAFIQEKLLPRLNFNPGLALTGFRTTRPSTIIWPQDIQVESTFYACCERDSGLLKPIQLTEVYYQDVSAVDADKLPLLNKRWLIYPNTVSPQTSHHSLSWASISLNIHSEKRTVRGKEIRLYPHLYDDKGGTHRSDSLA